MSYITDNLIPNEQVLYRTRLHWKIFVPAVLLLLLCLSVIVVAIDGGLNPFVSAYLTWHFSEFGVTDKRVLIKTGIVGRHTLETLLTKVENIGVEQSLWGRLFGYGTIYVTGTGSTKETFPGIDAPLEFRKQIEAAAVAFEERRPSARSLS
jgi:uncharacterized membrane protein YdbT with pleckstrin-like domain